MKAIVRVILIFSSCLGLQSGGFCSGAVARQLLNSVSASIAGSKALEYTSIIQMANPRGGTQKLYVHMKIQRPNYFWALFSSKACDDPKGFEVVSNKTAVYEYDPGRNVFTVSPPLAPNTGIKQDFLNAAGLIFHVAGQFMGSSDKPFTNLLPEDPDHPLSLTRRAPDLPGAEVITSNMAGDGDVENLAKLWVDADDSLPKRYVVSVLQNGSESVSYEEDWQTFKPDLSFTDADFNPNIPTNADPWKQQAPTVEARSFQQVDLSSYFNQTGIYDDGVSYPASAGLDGTNSYSGTLLGSALTWSGIKFTYGPSGSNDVIMCSGQPISLPAGNFSSLDVLDGAVVDDEQSQLFTITYADGTTQFFSQSVSNWWSSRDLPNETTAVSMDYLTSSTGAKSAHNVYVHVFSIPLNHAKAVKNIVVPNNLKVKILAMDLL